MFLGIDQGTTGSTAVLLSKKGSPLAKFTAAVPQHFPRPGWVEHDPEEIWRSVKAAIVGAIRKSGTDPKQIQSIGITNQRETVSVFRGSKPLHRFIVWQDRRTTESCEELKDFENLVRNKTGLPIDPYFSATKIRWLMKRLKLSAKTPFRFRTIDSFLLERMTGADKIEATNASRTSLMNLKSLRWDRDLFELFQIPFSSAPEIIPSEGFEFRTKGLDFLPDGIPIRAALGDQQAALFGQMGWDRGAGKITYGTGSFILLNIGDRPVVSKNGLVTTLAIQWSSQKKSYALEGSAFICGAWIQWLRDQLQILQSSDESEKLARLVSDSAGVMIVPALAGMGAPFWRPRLRGAILGLTRGSNRHHIARASLEALCFQNKALVDAMKLDLPKLKPSWRVDGGAVKNNLLLQIQANLLGTKIVRPRNLEATATGVALLAAFSGNFLSLSEIERQWKKDRLFSPQVIEKRKLLESFRHWLSVVEAPGSSLELSQTSD
jgi:glycerol kinase